MNLEGLQTIVNGLDSLADVEKVHPVLGARLLHFVQRVEGCCTDAYGRLRTTMHAVRDLAETPQEADIAAVVATLREAPSKKWFKDVSEICQRLGVLASEARPDLRAQIDWAQNDPSPTHAALRGKGYARLSELLVTLEGKEQDLKQDVRSAVSSLEHLLTEKPPKVSEAKKLAAEVDASIVAHLDRITEVTTRIEASGTNGADAALAPPSASLSNMDRARPVHMAIIYLGGATTLASIALGAFAIYKNTEGDTEFSLLEATLKTSHVAVACIGIGLVIGFFTVRSVLSNLEKMAAGN